MNTKNLTATIALPLAGALFLAGLTACGQVADEAEEVVKADNLEEARAEAADVVDEIGDAVSADDKLEREKELDRQLDELEEAIAGLKTSDDEQSRLKRELSELRAELESAGEKTESEWKAFRSNAKQRIDKLKADISGD